MIEIWPYSLPITAGVQVHGVLSQGFPKPERLLFEYSIDCPRSATIKQLPDEVRVVCDYLGLGIVRAPVARLL